MLTRAVRWIAGIWAVASIGMVLAFVVGEGFHPSQIQPREWLGLVFFPVGICAGIPVPPELATVKGGRHALRFKRRQLTRGGRRRGGAQCCSCEAFQARTRDGQTAAGGSGWQRRQ